MCTMACDDDNYVLDGDGNRILIGLTLGETREFERLDELMSNSSFVPTDDSRSLNERRWLVLYDKHETAVRLYLSNQNAEAIRALRRG
jgi:hypothetical protein